MCGISGITDIKRGSKVHICRASEMHSSLKHRGPDESGIYVGKTTILVHSRLTIVDAQNGSQPMAVQINGKKYVMVYNGELYNTSEILTDLKSKGYSIKGHSDTAALLYSYIHYGEKCLEKLNGIFAFAILEENTGDIFMARDRLGVKPMFYAYINEVFVFASEIKGILASGLIKPSVSSKGITEIFMIGPGRTNGQGVFDGIEELCPGECLRYSGGVIKKRRYWDLKVHPHSENEEETAEHVRYLVEDSIKRQLVSDIPVCTFLSGGLDSSIITYVASRELKTLHTFSVNYTDNDKYFKKSYYQPNSDDSYIGIMSRYCCSSHHPVTLGIDELIEGLYGGVTARDLPGMADVDSSLYLFCKEIKKHNSVALSGECADEIFGGYPWYHNEALYKRECFPWSGNLNDRYSLIRPGLMSHDYAKEYVLHRYYSTVEKAEYLPEDSETDKFMRKMFMLNINWFMQTLLDRKDRMSMANSLEVRVPFCDHRLVEYAYNIPWEIKSTHGREKGILRKAFDGILPAEIIDRKKSPYPKTHNPLYYNKVAEILKGIIEKPSSPLNEITNTARIKEIIADENSFASPIYGQLMTKPQVFAYLIQINYWLEKYGINITA